MHVSPGYAILTVPVVQKNIIEIIFIMILCLHLGNTSVYGVINQPGVNENGTVFYFKDSLILFVSSVITFDVIVLYVF